MTAFSRIWRGERLEIGLLIVEYEKNRVFPGSSGQTDPHLMKGRAVFRIMLISEKGNFSSKESECFRQIVGAIT